MAIFINSFTRSNQPILRETIDKMYISGSGHSKATFKPQFCDIYAGYPTYTTSDLASYGNQIAVSHLAFGAAETLTGAEQLAASTTGDCYTGGLELFSTFKSANGKTYTTAPLAQSPGNHPIISEVGPSGEVIRSSTIATHANYQFLLENETHIFMFARHAPYVINVTAATAYNQLVAVNKADLTVTGVSSVTSSISTSGFNVFVVVDIDQNDKKVTLFLNRSASYGAIPWGVAGDAGVSVCTLNASTGAGILTYAPVSAPVGGTPIGSASASKNRVWSDATKMISNGSTKTLFMLDEAVNEPEASLLSITHDPATEAAAASVCAKITRSVTSNASYATSRRHTLRIIDRGSYFYVVLFYAMSVKPYSLTQSNHDSFIKVYRGTKTNPTVLEHCSDFKIRSGTHLMGYLNISGDYTQLMLIHRDAFPDIIQFNEAEQAFEYKSTLDQMVKMAMVDSLKRLWYVDSTNTVHLQGPSVGQTIRVAFQDPSLTYEGAQINTNVMVSCFNFMGDRVANNITIQLEGGAALFSTNNSPTITVMSSVADDIKVPITITGNGFVRAIANLAL